MSNYFLDKPYAVHVTMRNWIGKSNPSGFGSYMWYGDTHAQYMSFIERCRRFGDRFETVRAPMRAPK